MIARLYAIRGDVLAYAMFAAALLKSCLPSVPSIPE